MRHAYNSICSENLLKAYTVSLSVDVLLVLAGA